MSNDTRSTGRMVKCPGCDLFVLISMADGSSPPVGTPFSCPSEEGGCGRPLVLSDDGCRLADEDDPTLDGG